MAEILLEGRKCETCDTEVRKGALFCYHCGASVAPDVAVTTDLDKKVSDAWFREEVAAPGLESEEAETIEETVEDESVEEAEESEVAGKTDDETVIGEDNAEADDEETVIEKDAEAETDEKPKLKTAAAMRRKPKRIQKKRVEIVWEEPNSPPNVWFLIATVLFAALAVGLWFVAKYLG